MVYKLNVTEHADELLDRLVYHLIYRLKNKQAAKHLLDCINAIYDRLEVKPFQFPECFVIFCVLLFMFMALSAPGLIVE